MRFDDKQVTVAEDDEGLSGVLVLDETDEGFLVYNVAVHPDATGHGRRPSPARVRRVRGSIGRGSTPSTCSLTRR